MPYPTYSKQDLATYSGRPLASFKNYAEEALSQALLLFKMGTCLATLPTDEDQAQLAKYAILAMADTMYLSQQYAKAKASPFSSESIGSYSYSKSAQQVQKGEKTGVMWFDLAIEQLSVCGEGDDIPFSGGIEVFEHDARFVAGGNGDNVRMLSPVDLELSRQWGFDPAPRS